MASRWRFEIQRIESTDTIRWIYCRVCRCGCEAKWVRIRRWLKFAGYRFLPLWGVERYLECQQCGEKYDPEILKLNPGMKALPLDRQLLRVMIYAALADGLIDSTEQKAIETLYAEHFEMVLVEEQFKLEVEAAKGKFPSLKDFAQAGAELMTLEQKNLLVELAYQVMSASGELKPGHMRQLHNLANAIELPPEQIDRIVEMVKTRRRFAASEQAS